MIVCLVVTYCISVDTDEIEAEGDVSVLFRLLPTRYHQPNILVDN